MIRRACVDASGAIKLLEEDDQGEFVLKSQLAERPAPVGASSQFLCVPVGATDEKGDSFHPVQLPAGELRGQFPGGDLLSAFIQYDPQEPFTSFEKGGALLRLAAGF